MRCDINWLPVTLYIKIQPIHEKEGCMLCTYQQQVAVN